MTDDLHKLSQRKLSFFQTMKAVLWGFFGVRKGAGYQDDIARLNPVHVIVAGLLAAAIFVIALVAIVRWAVAGLA
ncbi:Protein of uncharacterised function (DUF2970) [Bordetella pertussis]|uniref:Membrane protein n=11 Tax=Bordetella TaxID=517 RepID=Q7VT16_BORPE|nr:MULTISPECIES: DUF2970 domain-containing protein [Bordetella]ETH39354.1 PF11174 family protein [Bordetella pertussis H918]ETH44374.1 PF11174 family protein [Bordetella pertussis H939]ETH48891.1 PF11174 family protein [Bordetella pertussis H921]ETH71566.1 PF11174 family protein [Bordetella pertussis STO1-CHLA-0011]ETH83980.1 PF11174 family protein [Bordetella pertussis STO1-CHOC-0017]ETH86984.1 PF11174 family protein [Bordetella pertussis STO1-CHOC-0018]ETH90459.1 PF11174 family protein [Bo